MLLDYPPHFSIRRGRSDSACQTSKILWHAASFPNEVHFSCKMRSVRGGVLLAVLLVARTQASDTRPLGAWGSIMEAGNVTLYSCRFPPHHWIPLFPHILKPEARSALRNTSVPPWDPELERWVEGTLQFYLKPLLTLPSTATPAPTWPEITISLWQWFGACWFTGKISTGKHDQQSHSAAWGLLKATY